MLDAGRLRSGRASTVSMSREKIKPVFTNGTWDPGADSGILVQTTWAVRVAARPRDEMRSGFGPGVRMMIGGSLMTCEDLVGVMPLDVEP
jgi:hypothetical protein